MPFDATTYPSAIGAIDADRPAVKLLWAAKGLLRSPRYWCRREMVGEGGRMCMMGALRRGALGERRSLWELSARERKAYETAMGALTTAVGDAVPTFNDLSTTRHRDVLAAFDRAIAEARQQRPQRWMRR